MRSFSPTRIVLLARKAQIELARQGYDLLEQKRAALMKEFLRTADDVMQDAEALQQAADSARYALARATAIAGSEAVRSAALAARSELPLQTKMVNVMGVEVPRIEQNGVSRSLLGRGYALSGTSTAIDEAALAFEVEVHTIIQLAQSELRLARLAREIQQTSRRLNALEHVLIPRLQAECDYIQMVLDERERYDNFRLRLVKRRRSRGGVESGDS
jgi:V/A-type H+-transporting ATPase subunit D